jgi:hypothetical protein
MGTIFGIVGGIVAVLVGVMFHHARLVLFALMIWWVYGWFTADPVRDHNEVEVRQEERFQVDAQKALVTLSQVEVAFEAYGNREVKGTVTNGSVARISQVALRCSYERPDEEDPWRLTTPVAMTGVIMPGQSQRLSFWLRGAASDAIVSTFDCKPSVYLDQSDLMRTGLVKPKTQDDKRIADSDIRVEARLGQIKQEYAPILARGSITNNGKSDIGYLSLSCSALMNDLGRVETIYGGTAIYVAPGETKPFDFPVGKMHVEDPRFGIQDVSCQVLRTRSNR